MFDWEIEKQTPSAYAIPDDYITGELMRENTSPERGKGTFQ